MGDDRLWKRAGQVAAGLWNTDYVWDTLTDGTPVCMAENPELPGCGAHGLTQEEAARELREARQEYIYAAFKDGQSVPGRTVKYNTEGNEKRFSMWFYFPDPQDDCRIEFANMTREEAVEWQQSKTWRRGAVTGVAVHHG